MGHGALIILLCTSALVLLVCLSPFQCPILLYETLGEPSVQVPPMPNSQCPMPNPHLCT
ncbi:MAG: hypothetical protein V7K98_19310 [Nostoc sp.]|uniref:hypothetical protein n=1 Tax=Nostoc sp. TaxID=1180 RepID=UPI002FF6EF89